LKAIVLGGGFGTRLRPLSCTRPKLLFPVANKPLLDWTLKRLAKSGIEEVVLAVNYMAEAFIKRYRSFTYGMKITYSKEAKPLGTGGPIKKAEKLIGRDEPFLVLNGDILTNIDYAKLLKKHKEKNATATIALFGVENPSRYGIAELTKNSCIKNFVEKPDRRRAPCNLANAGIYVLEPELFDYIPSGRPVSIENEVFPKLAAEGKLYGYNFSGLWIDIGEPADYLKANRLLLDTVVRQSQLGEDVIMDKETMIEAPSVVGKEVTLGEGSKIGFHTTVGDHSVVGRGVCIENSIVLARTTISDFASIRGAVIGEGAVIGKRVKIEDGCLVGDNAVIEDNVTLTRGVSICPSRTVAESVLTPKCLM